jgi:hypothetical protein
MDPERETGISQFFLALDPAGLGADGNAEIADGIVASIDLALSRPAHARSSCRECCASGVPVEEAVWREVRR